MLAVLKGHMSGRSHAHMWLSIAGDAGRTCAAIDSRIGVCFQPYAVKGRSHNGFSAQIGHGIRLQLHQPSASHSYEWEISASQITLWG